MNANEKPLCVVTGAAGFIGSHLAQALLDAGYAVAGVDDFSSGHERNMDAFARHPDFAFHRCSVTEPGVLADVLDGRGAAAVFHLAAVVSVPVSIDDPERTRVVNWEASRALHAQAREAGVRAFVVAGSAAEYGNAGERAVREEDADGGARRLSPYAVAKYVTSRLVTESGYGVSLRFFNVYGPRQDPSSEYSGVISRFVKLALEGRELTVLGSGEQVRDFLYVGDVVRALVRAAGLEGSEPMHGVYNVGGGTGTTILELAQLVRDITGTGAPIVFGPPRRGDIHFSLSDSSLFREVSGWAPQCDLRTGLAETVAWARGG